MNEIDLSKYQIRTDLVLDTLENIEDKDLKITKRSVNNIKITDIVVNSDYEKKINKKKGKYITIEFDDITDNTNKEQVIKALNSELESFLKHLKIKDTDTCLIIGLGNEKSTPDALGPLTIQNILITRHLFLLQGNNIEEGFRCVSAFSPSVTGITGIETSDLIDSIVDKIKPDFIIVVDALAASSIARVNKTIQITDSGIHPGSGVGNSRKEISKEVLGIPVIALGVPTIVDAATIVSDTINYMTKHFSYIKQNLNNPSNKLKIGETNYMKKNPKDLSKEEKKKYIGILGELNDNEIKSLIQEVLLPINYNLMVTPKEVDFLIDKLSEVLSKGINSSLHKKITL